MPSVNTPSACCGDRRAANFIREIDILPNMPDANLEISQKETYLKAIENSAGSRQYNSLYVRFKNSGKTKDILENGEYSCAVFVSSLLFLAGIIDKQRATVESLKKFCERSNNWKQINNDKVQAGDVIFWEKKKYKEETEHSHAGFALNGKEAVSTFYKEKKVIKHSIYERDVDVVYRHLWFAESN
ncbi:MAG: hypothetical protein KAR00_00230 [Candidatus Pacebacteria bacterium]|nr:hypothetical protein [Candidatus Paceibacterota bacterium]